MAGPEPFIGSEWGVREPPRGARTEELETARARRLGRATGDPRRPPKRSRRQRLQPPGRPRRWLAAVAAVPAAVAAGAGTSAVLAEEIRELNRGHVSAAVAEVRDSHRAAIRRADRTPRVLGVPRRTLESIAECESHGDPRAVSSDGTYRGKYQFDRGTWRSNGGSGDPAKAPELEQDLRAAALYKFAGSSPRPSCG